MVFVTHNQAFEPLLQTDRALDPPAVTVASEFSTILGPWLGAVVPLWAHQFNEPIVQVLAQRIAVGRLVVYRLGCRPESGVNDRPNQHRPVQIHLVLVGAGDVCCQWEIVPVSQQQDLGAFALAADADRSPPFFARENEPSAKSTRQSICRNSSSWFTSKPQAQRHTPRAVQTWNRRQQVTYEGKSRANSFHRAPLRGTHKMPSRQGRAAIGGRPRARVISFSGNKSAIRTIGRRTVADEIVPPLVDVQLRRQPRGHQVSIRTMAGACFRSEHYAKPGPHRVRYPTGFVTVSNRIGRF